MKTTRALNVQQKLFLFPALIIGVMFVSWGWYSEVNQGIESENAFRGQLSVLALTSTFMSHGSAELLAQEKGWEFHRVIVNADADTTSFGRIEQRALKALSADASLKNYEEKIPTDSAQMLAIFVPARIQSDCYTCHSESGVDIFDGKKEGELVAVFGVAGSLNQVEAHQAEILYLTAAICIVCVVVTIVVIRMTSGRVVVGPVKELSLQSEKVATGDLRSMVTPYLERSMVSQDEIGSLSRAYKTMLDSLRSLVLRLVDSANSVASASQQISSTSEEIAAGTFQQSSQVGEVATMIEEMSNSIHENSQNAVQTADTARKASQSAAGGEQLVRQTIEGMKRIAVVTRDSARTVKTLEHSSEQISEIISVIDGIADQTTLLALNAAIEAARAGEQGRGFAVVAGEVQKLADRTTSATKEISDMIKKIQSDTRDAVRSMDEGTREVEKGIQLAEQAGTALTEIKTTSEQMSTMIGQIADVSKDQSVNAEQMTKNVVSITNMTSQTATGVQQIALSLEELNNLTITLQSIVNNFVLDGQERSSDPKENERKAPADEYARYGSPLEMNHEEEIAQL
ncbi:MAG: methyl-accepting chemotaxis protein [Bacteroidetes bacterium]|nr:methyl-accepting chemotaxis protein [Bacteroidota bacterium]